MTFKDAVKIVCNRYRVSATMATETIKACFAYDRQGKREMQRMTENEFLSQLDELEAQGTIKKEG